MSLATMPERSHEQRMAALEVANLIRSHRSRLKRDLKAGRIGLGPLLDDGFCDTMKLIDALLALPHVGRVKANRLLRQNQISPSKTLGGLSARQRHELLEALR